MMKIINVSRTNTRKVVSGALYDFLGYLSTLKADLTVGGSHNVLPLFDHFKIWATKRNLNIKDADVENWNGKV